MTNTTQETEAKTFLKVKANIDSIEDQFSNHYEYELSLCQMFYSERLKIEQSQPVKSLDQCISDYLQEMDNPQPFVDRPDWMRGIDGPVLQAIKVIAELYAKQSQPKPVSDEDLCKAYTSFFGEVIDNKAQIAKICFTGEELFDFIKFVTGKQ